MVLFGFVAVAQTHFVHSAIGPKEYPSLLKSWHCLLDPQTMR